MKFINEPIALPLNGIAFCKDYPCPMKGTCIDHGCDIYSPPPPCPEKTYECIPGLRVK